MKIVIDTEKCILAGECYYNHPELFSRDASGTPIVRVDDLDPAARKKIAEAAAKLCPAGAISVE
jgi:ferredoxin